MRVDGTMSTCFSMAKEAETPGLLNIGNMLKTMDLGEEANFGLVFDVDGKDKHGDYKGKDKATLGETVHKIVVTSSKVVTKMSNSTKRNVTTTHEDRNEVVEVLETKELRPG